MTFQVVRKTAFVVATFALSVAMLFSTGCTNPQPANLQNEAITASQYMVNLAEQSTKLAEKLKEFSAATSENKLSAMQAKADEAYAILDKINELEAPESVKQLKDKYNEATKQLKDALSEYVKLYTEVADASSQSAIEAASTTLRSSSASANTTNPPAGSVDIPQYSERIEAIQKAYDSALNTLSEADKLSTEL